MSELHEIRLLNWQARSVDVRYRLFLDEIKTSILPPTSGEAKQAIISCLWRDGLNQQTKNE